MIARKPILRVSRTSVQNKTYKLKRSIINQTEEVILLKNNRELKQPFQMTFLLPSTSSLLKLPNENSKSFIDDKVNLDCWVNIYRVFSLT